MTKPFDRVITVMFENQYRSYVIQHPFLKKLASAGADIHAMKRKNFNLYFQFGIITQYSIFGQVIDESPSDIPDIWPVINIKIATK